MRHSAAAASLRSKLLKAAGLMILAAVLYRVGPHNIWERLRQLGAGFVLLAAGLSIPHLACKSERWRRLAFAGGVRFPASYAFFSYLAGIAMGSFTPGRAGEFFRAWLPVRDFGASLAASLAGVIVDRLFDLAFLILVSCAAAAFLLGQTLWLLLLPAFFSLLYVLRSPLRRLFFSIYERLPLPAEGRKMFWDATRKGVALWPHLSIWTIAGYTFMNLQVYVIAAGMDVPIGFGELFLLFGLANTVALMPVSVLGLGTREAALGALFVMSGHSETHGVSIALSFFLFGSIPAVLAGAAWLLLHRSPPEEGRRACDGEQATGDR